VKDFSCSDIPRGGREKDKRKRIVNREEKIINRPDFNGEEFSKDLFCVVKINCF